MRIAYVSSSGPFLSLSEIWAPMMAPMCVNIVNVVDSIHIDERNNVATLLERYQRAPADVRRQVDLLLRQAEDDRAWTEQLGPVYTQGQVAELLGKSKQAVSTDKGLLRLDMRDGRVGYPVFQFEGDRILPGMQDVVRALAPVAATSWTVASWLTSPSSDLGGETPLERLRRGDVSEVTVVADRLAARLGSLMPLGEPPAAAGSLTTIRPGALPALSSFASGGGTCPTEPSGRRRGGSRPRQPTRSPVAGSTCLRPLGPATSPNGRRCGPRGVAGPPGQPARGRVGSQGCRANRGADRDAARG
jgi:hypothetical protein